MAALDKAIHIDELPRDNDTTPQDWLTIDETASELGMSPKTLRDEMARKEGSSRPPAKWFLQPAHKDKQNSKFTREQVEQMKEARKRKSKEEATDSDNTGFLFEDLPSGAPEEKAKEKAPVDSTGATAFKQKEATSNYTPKPSQQRYSTELDKAHEALTFISPDLARDDWVRVGMALKNEFGDNGFSLFDEWSRGGKSYKEGDANDTWKSINSSGGVRIGTLYHVAKQAGWDGAGVAPAQGLTRDFVAVSEDAEKAESRAKAAAIAQDLLNEATPITDSSNHPYIVGKGVSVSGTNGLYSLPVLTFQAIAGYIPRGDNGELTSPLLLARVTDNKGDVSTVEMIGANGQKSALKGGKKGGCFWQSQELESGYAGLIYVAEGIATALSIREATAAPTVAALTQGNLINTARSIKAKHPSASIVIACDLSKASDKPDSKLLENIRKSGFAMVWPEFKERQQDQDTDFNDMHQKEGLGATAARLADLSSGANHWGEPEPFLGATNATPYPVEALPSVIGDAVREVQAYVKAPMALVAGCALSAVSIACQALCNVSRNGMKPVPISLYFLTVAESGERKTTAEGHFFEAIDKHESDAAIDLREEKIRRESRMAAWSAAREGIVSKAKKEASKGGNVDAVTQELEDHDLTKPEPLKLPEYRIGGDTTPEGLGRAIAKGWPSRGVVSSEAGTFFGSHAMGRDSVTRSFAFFNTMWDGKPYEVIRSGNAGADSYKIDGARLTLSLQVQGATLKAFFEKNGELARGTGFLARFLIAWPETTQGTRYILETDKAPDLALERFNDRIAALLEDSDLKAIVEGKKLEPRVLTLAPDANAAWVRFFNSIESQLSPSGALESIRDVASKAAENAARLAALFHLIEGHQSEQIGRDSVERAAKVIAWYLCESIRFFEEMDLPDDVAEAQTLEKWLISYCNKQGITSVSKVEAMQKCPNKMRDAEKIQKAVSKLSSLSRARLVQDNGKQVIQVNPALLKQ